MAGAYVVEIPPGEQRMIPIPGGGVPGKVAVTYSVDFDRPKLRIARWENHRLVAIFDHQMEVDGRNKRIDWFDTGRHAFAALGVTNRSTKATVSALVEYGIK